MTTRHLLAAFPGWLIKPEWAARVIAGAYDAKSPSERRDIVEANPYSYLGVTRSAEDLADGDAADDQELVRRGAQTLLGILDAGAFAATGSSTLYVYRLTFAGHAQTGVVGALDVEAFTDGRVLTHENVRPDRAGLLARHLREVGATSSPITLTHRANPAVTELLDLVATRTATVDHVIEEVRHQVWPLTEPEAETVSSLLDSVTLYVTDGHHRSAAALAGAASQPEPTFLRTLAAVFPDDALRVEAFHRRVPDRQGRTTEALIAALQEIGSVQRCGTQEEARPQAPQQIGVYHQHHWLLLTLPQPETASAVGRLDVERLRQDIIAEVFGIDELIPNSGIDYVPAPSGIDEVRLRCDEDGSVGFIMYPTTVGDLMAVADARELMPPKSSYVAPKPRSGIFLRLLGTGATRHLGEP
jgi:uncharacterized protein (DUF1015 family)